LNNIGSDFYASTLGGDKELMYKLISPYVFNNVPFTSYVNETTNLRKMLEGLDAGTYILKPNDESASIGVHKIEISASNIENNLKLLTKYQKTYPQFCVQTYIDGPEVEVPLLYYAGDYFCPGCVELLNSSPSGYLDYDTVKMDNYLFEEYDNDLSGELVACSIKIAKILKFKTICRIDFRIKNNTPYIIDIGANPTVSYHSSTNYIFRKYFDKGSAVYQLLLFMGLTKTGLFKPPFDKTK
jgi:D-alanine-D-alanine ligase-like ATP-grasp enzyme